MDIWQTALAIGALITALVCRREPRALLWIAAGALNFVVTAAYQARGLPFHPIFTGFADSTICLAIYFIGQQKWEMLVWRVYQTSVLVSLLYVIRAFDSHYTYIVALEACNWAALLVMGGTQLLRAADHGAWGLSRLRTYGGLHRVVLALCSKRAKAPFHHHSGW